MIVIMKMQAAEKEIDAVVARIKKEGLKPHISAGEERTIIGIIGDERKMDKGGLSRMDGVDRVWPLSVGYPGAGHTVCVFRYTGTWYLLNYKIQAIDDPNEAPMLVAEWGTKAPAVPAVEWFVFETLDPPWRPAAIGPGGTVPTD